jgi:hypothetical protein
VAIIILSVIRSSKKENKTMKCAYYEKQQPESTASTNTTKLKGKERIGS